LSLGILYIFLKHDWIRTKEENQEELNLSFTFFTIFGLSVATIILSGCVFICDITPTS
jgi:hypothetical protein